MKRSHLTICGLLLLIAFTCIWPGRLNLAIHGMIIGFVHSANQKVEEACGTSSFEFFNKSDRTVSNLDLDFFYVTTGGTNGALGFSRHFTNVIPGSSVVVRFHTPALTMIGLDCLHRPTISYWNGSAYEGAWHSSYSGVVVARPGEGAAISFDSPGKLTVMHGY